MKINVYCTDDSTQKYDNFLFLLEKVNHQTESQRLLFENGFHNHFVEVDSVAILEALKDKNGIWLIDLQHKMEGSHKIPFFPRRDEILNSLLPAVEDSQEFESNFAHIIELYKKLIDNFRDEEKDNFQLSNFLLAILILMNRRYCIITTAATAYKNPRADDLFKLNVNWKDHFMAFPETEINLEHSDPSGWITDFKEKLLKLVKPILSISEFLNKMADLTENECHNFSKEKRELLKYFNNGLWDRNRKIPVQLSYLIDFLGYYDSEFINIFFRNRKENIGNGHPIMEALKFLGTNLDNEHACAEDEGRFSISLLGVVILAFGAYRHKTDFNGDHDKLFIDAIRKIDQFDDPGIITRNDKGCFIAPRSKKEWKIIGEIIYQLFSEIYLYDKPCAHNDFNGRVICLNSITLYNINLSESDREISFFFSIDAKKLIRLLNEATEALKNFQKPKEYGKVLGLLIEFTLVAKHSNLRQKQNFWGKSSSFMVESLENKHGGTSLVMKFKV